MFICVANCKQSQVAGSLASGRARSALFCLCDTEVMRERQDFAACPETKRYSTLDVFLNRPSWRVGAGPLAALFAAE